MAHRHPTQRLLLMCFCATACSPTLRNVPTGEHSLSEAILVDYPPPPAQIEEFKLRESGNPRCAWLDGYWVWIGRRWEWQPGRTVLTPPNCYFAKNDLFWAAGKLHFRPARWYALDNLHRPCPAPQPCTPSAK